MPALLASLELLRSGPARQGNPGLGKRTQGRHPLAKGLKPRLTNLKCISLVEEEGDGNPG